MSPTDDHTTDPLQVHPRGNEVPLVTPGPGRRGSQPVLRPPLSRDQLRLAICGGATVANGPIPVDLRMSRAERLELSATLHRGYAYAGSHCYGSTEAVSYAYLLSRECDDLASATIMRHRYGRYAEIEIDCGSSRTLVGQPRDDGYHAYVADIRRAMLEHGVSDQSARRASVGASIVRARNVPVRAADALCRRLLYLAESRRAEVLAISQGEVVR